MFSFVGSTCTTKSRRTLLPHFLPDVGWWSIELVKIGFDVYDSNRELYLYIIDSLQMDSDPNHYRYLNQGKCVKVKGINDQEDFREVQVGDVSYCR